MKLLAMDLSLSCPAFAVLEVSEGVAEVVHLSHIKTDSKKRIGYRLFQIYNHLQSVYDEHGDITEVVREKGFSRFPAVTQTLFKVVGISDICSFRNNVDVIHEVAPTTVKKAITGSGRATKDDVADGLSIYIGTDINFKTDDESDAIAVGITHLLKKKALA